MNQGHVTGMYVLFLLAFGIGLILFALWVFCLLSGPEFGACSLAAVTAI